MSTDMRHMDYLEAVALDDVAVLRRKEATYQGSWKRRGGVGAFMMMARKWDRLEIISSNGKYDIFDTIESCPSGADGSALAEVRDLRRYLLLVEAEMRARGLVSSETSEKTQVAGGPEEPVRSEWPWMIKSKDLPEHLDAYYQRWMPDQVILEPSVTNARHYNLQNVRDELSTAIAALYVPTGRGYAILRISDAPPSLRELWPVLSREYNSHEHARLLSWSQALFDRDETAAKWRIRPEFAAWCRAEQG